LRGLRPSSGCVLAFLDGARGASAFPAFLPSFPSLLLALAPALPHPQYLCRRWAFAWVLVIFVLSCFVFDDAVSGKKLIVLPTLIVRQPVVAHDGLSGLQGLA